MGINNLLKHRCSIERLSDGGEDSYGITSDTYSSIGTNVKCHIQQISRLSSDYKQYITGMDNNMFFIGYFKNDENIVEGDRVTWEEYKMTVLSVPPSKSGKINKTHHKEAFMKLQDK